MSNNIVYNMNYDDYRNHDFLAKSDLDLININPSMYFWKKNAPKVKGKSKALEFGTLFHKCVLENDEYNSEYVKPLYWKDSKTALELLDKWGINVEEGLKEPDIIKHFEKAVNKGACGYTLDDVDKCASMLQSLKSHPYYDELFYKGESEVSYFVKDFGSEVGVKCRADFINDDRLVIVDLKTTSRPAEIDKSIIQYRYDVQAAFYIDVIKAITGINHRFIFCFVSTVVMYDSYPVYFVELTDSQLESARGKYRTNLESYCNYINDDNISFINIDVKKWW